MATIATQLPLFNTRLDQVINVAKVRQLSPFRYPGGKTWLVPRVRAWLRGRQPAEFIEPFAGGGIVSLSVAAENLARRVTMVEIDEQVAAVWQTIFEENKGAWLADRITDFDLSLESLRRELAQMPASVSERAFQTILKNRTHHGGILAAGAAPLKQGENGKGVKSRWYAETLKARILALDNLRGRIKFIAGDGLNVIRQNLNRPDVVFFLDPPYTADGKRAGRRLYNHHELDHQELFALMAKAAGDFLMTYDNAAGIWELARRHGFDCEPVAMKNTHHTEMTELLIGRNLGWARMEETAKCV
jgi:DNA adenine methylase